MVCYGSGTVSLNCEVYVCASGSGADFYKKSPIFALLLAKKPGNPGFLTILG